MAESLEQSAKLSAAPALRVVEEYLGQLNEIHSSGAGVPETSYYTALCNLFNGIGDTLKPRVRCIIHTRNKGAGLPDGGLFTADQVRPNAEVDWRGGQLPARGAIEVKGTAKEVGVIALSRQVRDYLALYGIVIVSNLRSFVILTAEVDGSPKVMESFSLANGELDFWTRVAANPRGTAQREGARFVEFLHRACLHNVPLNNPRDVAWFLASYAHDALARVERHKELPALQTVRAAIEDALGMKFTAEKGEHFFRSTLVQTIFYGVFSAWVLWHRDNPSPAAHFDWRTAEWSLHVPFIRTLYEEVAKPSRLGPLGLVEVLDWSAGVLNRVDRVEFFRRFQDEHAVQYFYEPFLEAYDPELRKNLGVWYTPREIVKYQVARVDTVLREELNLPDGLADPNVIVLDPCCGTGAYLVETLRLIAQTLRDKGGDALVAAELKAAAINRVFGFEIMPAPFVVAHLQLGLMLQEQGVPLSARKGERVGVYLTNALTGWEPPKGVKQHLMSWAELEEERDAAEHVKREKKILVVLGNPPYNAFAGISPQEEQGLVEPYKRGLNAPASAGGWGIKKFNLDDLYVRFFRLAERRIAEMSGMGVVSFISNFSYLDDASFVVMRQRFLAEFDKLWFDCMNGDSRETGKLTPEGKSDPSVFSTEYNREGIRVGTAVCVVVRKPVRSKTPTVRFRQFWGMGKRAELLNSLNAKKFNAGYVQTAPSPDNRFSFGAENVSKDYRQWPKLTELSAVAPFNGPVERRGSSLISIDRDPLHERIKAYFDVRVTDSSVAALHPSLLMTGNRIVGPEARKKIQHEHVFDGKLIVHYPFKPLDLRWAYLANIRPLFSEPSPQLLAQRFMGNAFFISRDTADKAIEGPPFFFSKLVCDYDSISGHARHFPILLKNGSRLEKDAEATLFAALGEKPEIDEPVANLSAALREYLIGLRIRNPDQARNAAIIWLHALAIGFSPAYLTQNADGVRRDWPRIPLPNDRKLLEASAALGGQVAALLDTDAEVPGVTSGKIGPLFKLIAPVAKVGGGSIDPSNEELAVTAGWAHAGKDGVTMPAKGKLSLRPYAEAEVKAIETDAFSRGMAHKDGIALLGDETCDILLNDFVYWRNVPRRVWDYHIGGYQVMKKWLSYRESKLLGRALKTEEAREATNIVRRLTAIVLLQPKLDENYRIVKSNAFEWKASIP